MMIMAESPLPSLLRRQSTMRKKVHFRRMYESYRRSQSNEIDEDNEIINENKFIDNDDLPERNSRTSIQWKSDREGDDINAKQINTDAAYFDALFARSNATSPPPSPHPRCYSSCSPSTVPFQIFTQASTHNYAKSQPLLFSSSSSSYSAKVQQQLANKQDRRSPTISSNKSQQSNSTLSTNSAQMKRKTFSLTHAAQALLQSTNSQSEPLARSCSYKRPQSIKKYRQQNRGKEKEKEQKEYSSSSRKYSTHNNNILHTVASDSARKSISSTTSKISAIDLMANYDSYDQWSNPKAQRSARVGSLPLDQLQIPHDTDEEIYRVRQFNTTSKGFVNRGDSFKRSFKRNGSVSRRSSIRKIDQTPSQEHINNAIFSNNDIRTSTNSLTNSNLTTPAGPNLSGILDKNFIDSTNENTILSIQIDNENEENIDDDDDDNPLVDRIETEDGHVQNIRIYHVYLLGMSGTGKCSLLRQFKTTEYRGIYDYSSSIDDDPDNTVSIMLDGIESRLHIINIDVDLVKCSVTGDAYMVVYSITDRQSFQTAIQLIKNIREKELADQETSMKRYVPIILVGNKSDLVRKRAVTKEMARNAAFRYDCKFVETSVAINDKVDDLLAGTLKQIRINDQKRLEQRRRLTIANSTINSSQIDNDLSTKSSHQRKISAVPNQNSKNFFSKFLNVFRKKPTRLPADVENLNIGIR